MHTTGRYRNQCVELDQPIGLAEDTPVEVEVRPLRSQRQAEAGTWSNLGMDRLEEEWDNPEDAVYDDWKSLYGTRRR